MCVCYCAESMSSLAQPGDTVDLSSTFLFCCGVEWNGTANSLSYTAINWSLPRQVFEHNTLEHNTL